LMEKEASFFNAFLPKMREFCGRFEGCEDLLNFFPKLVYADDDCLVLENLVLDEGFVMLNREDRQGLTTAKKVLTNLATLHAVSYAYIREDYSDSVVEFREDWELICKEAFLREDLPMTNTMFMGALKQAFYILQQNHVAGADIAIEQLSEFLDDDAGHGRLKQLVLDLLKPEVQGKVQVVNHGDCWNNNMLFKLNPENGEPKDNILLDFQVTRLGSPCLDLGYYLFLSVDPGVRRDHLQDLLQHYFDDFQNVLEKLLGLQCPISFEEFVADYKAKFQVGLFMAMTVMGALGGVTEVDMEGLPPDGETVRRALATAMRAWVDSHPVEATELSKELVAMLKERDELMNGD